MSEDIHRQLGAHDARIASLEAGQRDVWAKLDRMLNSPDDVAKMRAQRQQQQQAQQTAAMAPALKQGAEALRTAATTAPVDNNLAQALGQQFALPG